MISEEQIKAIFFKQFDMRHLKGRTWGPSDMALREGFKVAFTPLMPIIEKQDEIIKELLEVAEVHLDDTMEKIQETKQELDKAIECIAKADEIMGGKLQKENEEIKRDMNWILQKSRAKSSFCTKT